jgi:hypothetical protein
MAEKRKAQYVFLLRKAGKKKTWEKSVKIELFKSELWPRCGVKKKFRIRVNGKWVPKKKEFYNKWEFRDMLFSSVKI